MTTAIEQLRAAYDAGVEAGERSVPGVLPVPPYGKPTPGFATQRTTAWFLGYIHGGCIASRRRRCGTVAPTPKELQS